MKRNLGLCLVILMTAVVALVAVRSFAEEEKEGAKADADKKVIAEQKASYPLKTCVVKGEVIGEGEGVDYVYKDRLVRFCCKGCIKKFEQEPDKYLKMIDDAKAKAKEGEKKKDE
jgi:hypothetical protein